MSDNLGFNKIAGAVLATGLVLVGLPQLASIVFHKEPVTKPGYAIEVQEAAEGGAAGPELPPDWGTVLPTANVEGGKAQAAKCQSCHNLDKGGPNQTGPNLWGVVGRARATHPGFSYSGAMSANHDPWRFDTLFKFLKSPATYVPGTKMSFAGLRSAQDRINLLAWLRSQSDSPVAIPPPAPKSDNAQAPNGPAPVTKAPEGTPATPEVPKKN